MDFTNEVTCNTVYDFAGNEYTFFTEFYVYPTQYEAALFWYALKVNTTAAARSQVKLWTKIKQDATGFTLTADIYDGTNVEPHVYTNPAIKFTGWQNLGIELINSDTGTPGTFHNVVNASKF